MPVELYNDGNHACVAFRDLVTGDAVQANQFLIIDGGHAAIIDPGGELTYSRLYMALGNYLNVTGLDYVIASHQDPDIVASINKWLIGTDCKVVVPQLWERFIPHLCRSAKVREMEKRLIAIPDQGMALQIGDGSGVIHDPSPMVTVSGEGASEMKVGTLSGLAGVGFNFFCATFSPRPLRIR